jgi:hypothetical protein
VAASRGMASRRPARSGSPSRAARPTLTPRGSEPWRSIRRRCADARCRSLAPAKARSAYLSLPSEASSAP